MAFIPSSGSVVAFQSDPTKFLAEVGGLNKPTGSVTGNPVYIGGIDGDGSVVGARAVTVVTIPAGSAWLGLASVSGAVTAPAGSVMATNQVAGSVMAVAAGSVAAYVVGNSSVISYVQNSVATVIIGGSIAASFTPPANQSVSGAITAPSGSVAAVRTDNASVITVWKDSSVIALQLAGSILATSATVNPAANQSVSGAVTAPGGSVMATNQVAGSIMAVSAVQPAGSLLTAIQLAGSVMAVSGSFAPAANQSVSGAVTTQAGSIMSVTNPAGSVTTVIATNPAGSITSVTTPAGSTMAVLATQVTSPWVVTSSNTSIVGTYQEETVGGPSVRGIALVWESNASTSVMSTVSPTNPLRISGSVSGRVEATQPAGSLLTIIHPAGSITSVTAPAGSIAAVSATAPAGSIMATNQVAGSIMAVSATAPAGSIMATNQVAGSIMAVSGTFMTPAGSIQSNTVPAGSVAAVRTDNASVIVAFQNSSIVAIPTGSTITIMQGSVAAFMGGTWKPSVINLLTRNDTVASFLGANLVERPTMGDSAGRTIIKPFASEDATIISYTGSVTSGSVTLIQASAVGLKSYVTDFMIANTGSVAQLITFQDGSTSILGLTIAPATGGSNAIGMAIPLKTNTSQDLAFKATGTSSIIYVTVKGYQAP